MSSVRDLHEAVLPISLIPKRERKDRLKDYLQGKTSEEVNMIMYCLTGRKLVDGELVSKRKLHPSTLASVIVEGDMDNMDISELCTFIECPVELSVTNEFKEVLLFFLNRSIDITNSVVHKLLGYSKPKPKATVSEPETESDSQAVPQSDNITSRKVYLDVRYISFNPDTKRFRVLFGPFEGIKLGSFYVPLSSHITEMVEALTCIPLQHMAISKDMNLVLKPMVLASVLATVEGDFDNNCNFRVTAIE